MDDMFLQPKKRPKPALPQSRPLQAPQELPQSTVVEPAFKPPELVAREEEKQDKAAAGALPKPPKKASWWRRQSKKKKILILVPTIFVLLGGGASAFLLTREKPTPPAPAPEPVVEKIEEPPKPTTVASKLTGVQVQPELNQRGVTAIMIENSTDARPQSGLLEAGVVYEAIAEGGITRFMALFQEAQPTYIGPVRSARPYYIDWLMPYSATYAHAGGSNEALSMISSLGVRDMDHGANGSAYTRVDSRFAPHNLYTSMANLDAVRAKKGWGAPDFVGFPRKEDTLGKVLTATTINLNISGPTFAVKYEYDSALNSYKRTLAGQPHLDEKSGKQLEPKVIVALVVPYSIHPDGVHSKYQTVGSGQAFVFQDGVYQEASWTKATQKAQIEFKDAGGRVLQLNAGQTWITVVGQANMVTFTGPPAGATP